MLMFTQNGMDIVPYIYIYITWFVTPSAHPWEQQRAPGGPQERNSREHEEAFVVWSPSGPLQVGDAAEKSPLVTLFGSKIGCDQGE